MSLSKTYYTIAQLAKLLSVTKTTVHRWVHMKLIGTTRFGRNEVRFSEEQVQTFLRTENKAKKENNIWEDPIE